MGSKILKELRRVHLGSGVVEGSNVPPFKPPHYHMVTVEGAALRVDFENLVAAAARVIDRHRAGLSPLAVERAAPSAERWWTLADILAPAAARAVFPGRARTLQQPAGGGQQRGDPGPNCRSLPAQLV